MQRCDASLQLSEEPDVGDYHDEDDGEVRARELEEGPRGLRRLVDHELHAVSEYHRAQGGGRDDVERARRVWHQKDREGEDDQEGAGYRYADRRHPLAHDDGEHRYLRGPVLFPLLD